MFDAEDKCGQGRAEPSGVCVPVDLALQLGQHRGSCGELRASCPKACPQLCPPKPQAQNDRSVVRLEAEMEFLQVPGPRVRSLMSSKRSGGACGGCCHPVSPTGMACIVSNLCVIRGGGITVSVSQVWRLRPRQVRGLVQGHGAELTWKPSSPGPPYRWTQESSREQGYSGQERGLADPTPKPTSWLLEPWGC